MIGNSGVRQLTHRPFGRTFLTHTALLVVVVLWLALMILVVRAGLSLRVSTSIDNGAAESAQ